MSDASLFPIHFFDCDIFCKGCGQIKKFKVFSQDKYDKNYGKGNIPPNRPLFCRCEECDGKVIYATSEFAELQEDRTLGLCKIWEMGNLEVGDMVFHPTESLCMVDSINRVYNEPLRITLVKQNKEKVEIQMDAQFSSNESDTDVFYVLFPQNSENARIGDKIYHTETKLKGTVTGLEFNGGQTIFVKLENGEYADYHCKKITHYLTDETLELNVKWRCKDLPYSQNLLIYSNSKILNVNGRVPNFNAVCELNNILSSIPQLRCFITHVNVEKANKNSNDIYMELLKNCINICCCRIELEEQEIYITGFYSAMDIQKHIYRALAKFPIKKINFGIKMRPDIKTIKTINESERFVRISKIGKDFHIDGWVKSEKEKKKAKLKSFFSTFSFRVENHLLVLEK